MPDDQRVDDAIQFDQHLPAEIRKVEHPVTDVRLPAKVRAAFAVQHAKQPP